MMALNRSPESVKLRHHESIDSLSGENCFKNYLYNSMEKQKLPQQPEFLKESNQNVEFKSIQIKFNEIPTSSFRGEDFLRNPFIILQKSTSCHINQSSSWNQTKIRNLHLLIKINLRKFNEIPTSSFREDDFLRIPYVIPLKNTSCHSNQSSTLNQTKIRISIFTS